MSFAGPYLNKTVGSRIQTAMKNGKKKCHYLWGVWKSRMGEKTQANSPIHGRKKNEYFENLGIIINKVI